MAKTYSPGLPMKLLNGLMTQMLRRGLGPPGVALLTVHGRRSGQPYSTPVSPVERDDTCYVVSPYGTGGWARNARGTGEVSVGRGKRMMAYRVEAVAPEEAVPVLRQYVTENGITRPYFDVTAASSDQDWAAEAPRHPVFRLLPK
jgi:deazaflavin-dependent oxidoreductase (nitroreductase family)